MESALTPDVMNDGLSKSRALMDQCTLARQYAKAAQQIYFTEPMTMQPLTATNKPMKTSFYAKTGKFR
ncbi:MAG: hypothetical protein ACRYE9_01155 [Janthinobacterium lividum]